ncbi:MAG: glycosyltransferase [Chitinophagaceae bacterium]|nr:glycosyltransferase [Chitinophagaceae bacterium]
MTISVIICSHNPNLKKLNLVLDSLKKQDEPLNQWELLIVDNASDEAIENQVDVSWHPNCRFVVENELGISIARARGIQEASGELLVMVDDDGPLFPDYIRLSKKIALDNPHVVCFGGNQLSITQIKPDKKYKPYLEMIGFRVVNRDRISNMYRWETTPAGAGMVVRSFIAQLYADAVFNKKQHAALGRRGNSLMSSQDIDLSYNAIDQGYFTGVFADLKIYHLSIEENLNEDYLIRRRYHNVYSSNMLNYIRFNRTPKPMSRTKYIINQFLLLLQNRKFEYKMKQSEFQAIKKLQHQISTGEINRA